MNDRRHQTAATQPRSNNEPVTLVEWAVRRAPHLDEVSNSNPNATLRRHNLIAITDDLEAARVVALDFERITPADAARRSLLGGLPGAPLQPS